MQHTAREGDGKTAINEHFRLLAALPGTAIIQIAGVLWYEQEPPEETPTPTPAATWIVPPSPTPRVTRSVETPIGSSNIDFIMQQGTLVIGWVGPALFGILLAAFAWGAKVFQWLWSLVTWLFSGAWRDSGPPS